MTKILQVELYDQGLDSAVQGVIEQCKPGVPRESKCISATDAHGLVTATRNPEFKQLLDSFYWVLPDGMPSVWLGRMKGEKNMPRCYGPDLFKHVFQISANTE